MRLRAIIFAAVVLAGAGAAAFKLAEVAALRFEQSSAVQLDTALDAAGQPWAAVAADGLKVTLSGTAPDETSRFRALEIARQVVDAGRIADETTVAAAKPLAPPPFALELLRNEGEISLIGLVPDTGGRDVIRSALGAGGLSEHVTDMLDSAAEPAPDGWREALGFGLSVLAELPRAKISVAPGKVGVIAVADSDPDRARLEAGLRHAAPAGVALTLDISAPRPVIAPFAFDLDLREGKAVLAACSADSPEAAGRILDAARAAGLAGDPGCAVGLGSPSAGWETAVVHGIDALRTMGGGRFRLRDITAELTPPAGLAAAKLSEVGAALDAALPVVFQLTTKTPPAATAGTEPSTGPAPRFDASLRADGNVRLAGPVQDATSRAAIESYAASLFGHDRVINATVINPALPEGWPGRVLAGVEALAALKEGSLEVTPDRVAVRGWGIEQGISARVEALLAAKVGDAAVVDVAYNATAAASAADAARPRPEICADQIAGILEAGSIRFTAGSADILPESRGVIAAIADVLRGCPGADFLIGGYTDGQGDASANRRLSDDRARAVLAALEAEDLPLVHLTARGFGADDPVADNATEAGRARNRRIEFTLAAPDDAGDDIAADADGSGDDNGEAAEADADCAAQIDEILAADPIEFDAGSATIASTSAPIVARVGEALRGCPDAALEIGGYTDSQGSEQGNLRLSESRAQAVLAALRAPDLPLAAISARGFGEADPVADNATAEGRAKNRRIVFTAPAAEALAEGDADDAAGVGEADVGESPDAACSAQIETILAGKSIEFAAGSSTIAPESLPLIDGIAGALGGCPDAAIEIGGHTDSQGSEAGNQRLSEARAESVLAALRGKGLALPGVTAHGYGESEPVADNATAEGRARNRRIAFHLVTADAEGDDDGSE